MKKRIYLLIGFLAMGCENTDQAGSSHADIGHPNQYNWNAHLLQINKLNDAQQKCRDRLNAANHKQVDTFKALLSSECHMARSVNISEDEKRKARDHLSNDPKKLSAYLDAINQLEAGAAALNGLYDNLRPRMQ